VTLLDRMLGRTSPTTSELVAEDERLPALTERVNRLSEELRQEQENVLLATEQISELESALNENGWDKLDASEPGTEFSRAALQQITARCRLVTIANPLVKRGVALRVGYVWGRGISVEARAKGQEPGDQDVNAVVQDFWGDPSNQASWTGSQAREERERSLAVDGSIFAACFTSPLTGRVQLRTLPFDEIAEVITNPEDRDEPWFYKRDWIVEDFDAQGKLTRTRRIVFYPALDVAAGIPSGPGRRLRAKPRQITDIKGDTAQVQWDAPVLHVRVNALDGWKFGLPDVYAVLNWSRAYKEFLEDWAVLVKALSRYAYRVSTKGSRVAAIATRVRTAPSTNSVTGKSNDIGGTAVTDDFTTLEAVPKTGATIDSESGRPLAAMVAAGLGVPVTMLLGDPGMTGARATAETLDRPTELEMGLRRELWAETERRLLDYVIDQAVIAPQGPLKGTVKRDANGRDRVTLTGDTDNSMRTVDVSWPPLEDTPVDLLVKAITMADQTEKMPPLLTFRLLAQALDVEDIDELIDEMTDDQGNFIPLDVADQQVRGQMADRGQTGDPMAVPPNGGGQPNPNDQTNNQQPGQQNNLQQPARA
jgi:hypothetical protein